MKTKTLSCSCPHEYQDAAHGKQNRVHNGFIDKKTGDQMWRCTVCLRERMHLVIPKQVGASR